MRKFNFLIFLIILFTHLHLIAKEPKTLIFIIASDDLPIYRDSQTIWRSYMHSDPEHVEAYFIKGDPNLPTEYEIKGDIIWTKTKETLIPGLLDKTLIAMEAFLPRIEKEFDFVLRTNLSSLIVFKNLVPLLKTLPKKRCYAAARDVSYQIPYGLGSCFILSNDLVKLLVFNQQLLVNHFMVDDGALGLMFYNLRIPIRPNSEYSQFPLMKIQTVAEFLDLKETLKMTNAVQIRFKNRNSLMRDPDESYVHSELVKLFYRSCS